MKLRLATLDDATNLFDWRNDSITLQNSKSQNHINYDEHIAWLQSILNSVDTQIFILENEKLSLGSIRCFTNKTHQHYLSWTINPEHRKKGYGTTMLDLFFKNHYGKEYIAEIYNTNTASINLIRKFQFELISTHTMSDNRILLTYKKNNKTDDLQIINEIEKIRAKNNSHWMDVVKLAFKLSPVEARQIFKNIKDCDHQINVLLKELANNDDMD